MSQAHENIDVYHAGIGDDQYPPHMTQNQVLRGVSNFVDGSGPIFSMYLEMATEEDKKKVENWKADADGILIFTGLFSAAVASLISVSIQDIRQNPQDISNFYLANTYQATLRPNDLSSLPASPPAFSPPTYAIWVNALWFLSLVISLTCALLATFLQQWARRYLKVTQPRYSLHKRARIRAFFAEGVEKCLLPQAVEILPILLHVSLFLFFAGLVAFLSNVNLTIFKLVLSWVGVCLALYGSITLMPIFRHDSPYYTSLSSLVWTTVIGTAYFASVTSTVLLYWTGFCRRGTEWLRPFRRRCSELLWQGMHKTFEETAFRSSSEIDTRAFIWTSDSLDEDHELERFFAGLPGFRSSKVVGDPLPELSLKESLMLGRALTGLLDRTLASDLLPESVQRQRAMICVNALDPTHFPNSVDLLEKILLKFQCRGPLAAGIARVLRGWRDNWGEGTILYAQASISMVVATVKTRDSSWFTLASDSLGVSEAVLRNHAAHSNNLSLSILIHLVRLQFSHFGNRAWPMRSFSDVLEATSKFDVEDTSLDLQNDFCALWNQIVRKVQDDDDRDMAFYTLGRIRSVYVALHRDTDSAPTQFSASTGNRDNILHLPSSYPVCNIPGHHPALTALIHDHNASTTFVCAAPPLDAENTPVVPSFLPVISNNATSGSASALLHVDEPFADAPPLNSTISLPVQISPESDRISSSTLDPVTNRAINRNIDTSPKTNRISLSIPSPDLLASPPPSVSTSPPGVVSTDSEHTVVSTLGDPNTPLPASAPVLDSTEIPESY